MMNKFMEKDSRKVARKRVPWMLRQSDPVRVVWDMFIAVLLGYISLMLPYTLGFENGRETVVDQILNYIFLFDVVLNFRTAFNDADGVEIMEPMPVAMNYLKTWFTLDFFSSLPMPHIVLVLEMTGVGGGDLAVPNPQPAKLLKIGKIAKVFKVLKIGPLIASLGENSEIGDIVEEMLVSSSFLGVMKLLYLVFLTSFFAHWLACCMGIFSDDVATGYLGAGAVHDVGDSTLDRYWCAVYWAVTTMSTVGYGDFTPTTNAERGYTMVAMFVGASFYGYMIGNITSLVAEGDAHSKAYYEKMKKISAWCDHQEFPRLLRRRVRRYFKVYFTEKSALDEKGIMSDLSQELRTEVTEYMIHPAVRNHMMFESLGGAVLSKLVHVLERNTYKPEEKIVTRGQVSSAMYVLASGTAKWSDGTSERTLEPGDSFGEGIILGFTKRSECSVVADSVCQLYEVPYQEFRVAFQATPDVIDQMKDIMKGRKSESG
jgi:voltage-gated potassium channel